MNKTLIFTITENTNNTSFVIGAKYYNIKCQANEKYNHVYIPQTELFKAITTITERFNNVGFAVLFEVE